MPLVSFVAHLLLEALKVVGVESGTFFTALDASSELRAWYRGVKAAQATLDIEEAEGVLTQMEEDAGDEMMGNGVRNAKMQAAKLKLDQYRWMAQRLLPSSCLSSHSFCCSALTACNGGTVAATRGPFKDQHHVRN